MNAEEKITKAKECLDIVAKQEDELQFPYFGYNEAYALGETVIKIAHDRNLSIACEIVINGFMVFRAARPGTGLGNEKWMRNKRNTMMSCGHSSLYFTYSLAARGRTRDEGLMPASDYAICGGGFPIFVKNTGIIGYVCVSGLQHEEDHRVIMQAMNHILGAEAPETPFESGF